MNLEYREIPVEEIEIIKPLWEELNSHHGQITQYFSGYYSGMDFEKRKKNLLGRSIDIKFKIDLMTDTAACENIGYCISSVNHDGEGEIDSLFVKQSYRQYGIGDTLMKRALDWLESYNAGPIKIQVAFGNEEVFKFYSKYNFYPKYTMLFRLPE
jgi:ribosomal protein S18 acetylase RimI-like enzyme